MIKFVCASCGERLSVLDAHGGRKGVCPSCGAINRIPLKGYAETQPRAPIVARLAGNVTEPPERAAEPIMRGALSVPALSGRGEDPQPPTEETEETEVEETPHGAIGGETERHGSPVESNDFAASIEEESDQSPTEEPAPRPGSAQASPSQSASISNPAPAASLGIFGALTQADAVPEEKTFSASRQRAAREADTFAADYTGPARPARREWRLPRPVKIFLLVFVVLAIVGGLYCALYFGIPAVIRMLSNG